jgi:predicted RecB family nuclease
MKKRGSISASVFSTLYRPSRCERRVYLAATETAVVEPTELELLMREMGQEHEREHLAGFPDYRDLSEGNLSDRAARTRDAVDAGAPVIYQGVLRSLLPGTRDVVTGIPDLMIHADDGYLVRDCKLARSAEVKTHPEIRLQLQVYGWLFQQVFQRPPRALEAYLGDRTITPVPLLREEDARAELSAIRELTLLREEPYTPVGWSKCSACPYYERCWTAALAAHDVSLVYGIDQAAAMALRESGITTYEQLLDRHTPESLSELKRSQGTGTKKVGTRASRILDSARALAAGEVIPVEALALPGSDEMVMFDLEGVPPQYEEKETVYLWGMQIWGPGGAGPYQPAIAGFGPDGDMQGWEAFLQRCREILSRHGDIPFVHWAGYEKAKLTLYMQRFGDPRGTAARVLSLCFDLLSSVRAAFALPVPSYGLKSVEGLAGFTREMEEYGGDWSIARYIRAARSEDPDFRSAVMQDIMRYNAEDLRATWAVLQWARGLALMGPGLRRAGAGDK